MSAGALFRGKQSSSSTGQFQIGIIQLNQHWKFWLSLNILLFSRAFQQSDTN